MARELADPSIVAVVPRKMVVSLHSRASRAAVRPIVAPALRHPVAQRIRNRIGGPLSAVPAAAWPEENHHGRGAAPTVVGDEAVRGARWQRPTFLSREETRPSRHGVQLSRSARIASAACGATEGSQPVLSDDPPERPLHHLLGEERHPGNVETVGLPLAHPVRHDDLHRSDRALTPIEHQVGNGPVGEAHLLRHVGHIVRQILDDASVARDTRASARHARPRTLAPEPRPQGLEEPKLRRTVEHAFGRAAFTSPVREVGTPLASSAQKDRCPAARATKWLTRRRVIGQHERTRGIVRDGDSRGVVRSATGGFARAHDDERRRRLDSGSAGHHESVAGGWPSQGSAACSMDRPTPTLPAARRGAELDFSP